MRSLRTGREDEKRMRQQTVVREDSEHRYVIIADMSIGMIGGWMGGMRGQV